MTDPTSISQRESIEPSWRKRYGAGSIEMSWNGLLASCRLAEGASKYVNSNCLTSYEYWWFLPRIRLPSATDLSGTICLYSIAWAAEKCVCLTVLAWIVVPLDSLSLVELADFSLTLSFLNDFLSTFFFDLKGSEETQALLYLRKKLVTFWF